MWRLLFVIVAALPFAETSAQIPGEAFRDVFTINSRKNGKEFNAHVTVVDERVGLMPFATTSTGPVEWIAQPAEGVPFELRKCSVQLEKGRKEVVKTIDPEAIVYDLSGKDFGVFYRKPDERWGAMWKNEFHDHAKAEGSDDHFKYCQTAAGTLKGYYLDFQEKPIEVQGRLGWKTAFHPARLSKEPTPWGRVIFSGGRHSGVSR